MSVMPRRERTFDRFEAQATRRTATLSAVLHRDARKRSL